jgi:dUTP pyrophosphatase
LKVKVKKLSAEARDLVFAHRGDSGVDLFSTADLTIMPGERKLVPTGISLEIEAGFEGQVRPKSGLALEHGITVLNTPGTIDAAYRGEVCVIVVNHGGKPFKVEKGKKIAQMVFTKVEEPEIEYVKELGGTTRGAGGFGSTGFK